MKVFQYDMNVGMPVANKFRAMEMAGEQGASIIRKYLAAIEGDEFETLLLRLKASGESTAARLAADPNNPEIVMDMMIHNADTAGLCRTIMDVVNSVKRP